MGIDILVIFFFARDFNLYVFKSENSVAIEKTTRYFAVRIYLFYHFRWGQNLEYDFPLETMFWPNLSKFDPDKNEFSCTYAG